jgi:hypothetical protein
MKIKIDLLYFKGCPNVDQARDHLKKALAQLSLPIQWNEIDVEDPNTEPHLKGFPSPTILVNGFDVATGLKSAPGSSACKIGGIPETARIIESIKKSSSKRGMMAFFAAIPATTIAVFPSVFCPACYPALAALLSSFGLGFFASEAVIQPLTVTFLLIALLALFYQSYKLKKYGSFAIGVIGALGIYAGHYLFPSLVLTYTSVAMLIGASIWNLVNKKKLFNKRGECSSCES